MNRLKTKQLSSLKFIGNDVYNNQVINNRSLTQHNTKYGTEAFGKHLIIFSFSLFIRSLIGITRQGIIILENVQILTESLSVYDAMFAAYFIIYKQ